MESGILYVVYNKWISNPENEEMPYKIGVTKNTVEDRYYGLGFKMPGTFETLFAYRINDYLTAEKCLQGILNNFCIKGEWFILTQKELDLIKGNCEAMGGIPVTDEIESEIKIDTEITFNDTDDESELDNELDNSKMSLEDMIKTIGMKTFVKYYNKFINETQKDIIDYMNAHENYKINAIRTKVCTGKRIFRNNLEIQALEIISKSERVDNQTRENAIKLLKNKE